MIWVAFLAVISTLLAIAWLVRPDPVVTRFTKSPPVIARLNTPSPDATQQMRQVTLPTGDNYIIPAKSRGHFILVFDWQVSVRVNGESLTLTIPKLTATDFASIPRFLHSFISPLNNTIYAAIVHDYLYRDPKDPKAAALDRLTVDRIFYWAMRAKGVWRPTAGLMYLGVRVGGSASYKRSASSESATN